MAYIKWKTLFDRIFAFLLLLCVIPVILIIGIAIKIEDPSGPVFFQQQRIGKKEHVFILYKLRSMKMATQEKEKTLTDNERLLIVGSFIRSTSIDELPQLINILKGEMSFIGPRPLLVEYLPYYTCYERKRHNVKPGISGLAQVKGRNLLTWEEKFSLDVDYIENISLKMDLDIFKLTIKKVIKKSDILLSGNETTQNFVDYRLAQNPYSDYNTFSEKRD